VERCFFGWLADRVRDAKCVSAFGLIAMAGGMLLLPRADTAVLLFASSLLFGFGMGLSVTTMPFLLAALLVATVLIFALKLGRGRF